MLLFFLSTLKYLITACQFTWFQMRNWLLILRITYCGKSLFSCCFHNFLFVSDSLITMYLSVDIFSITCLGSIELLGCVDSCFASNNVLIIFYSNIFLLFSLSSEIPLMLLCLMMSHRFFILFSSFFLSLFPFLFFFSLGNFYCLNFKFADLFIYLFSLLKYSVESLYWFFF